jgi:hypothetical protein
MTDKNLPIIGIIAGGGDLPALIASIYKKQGGQCFIALIENEGDQKLLADYAGKKFAIGQVGAVIEYFKKTEVKEIIIIGKISRPDLGSLKVDLAGSKLVANILKNKFLGDDNALKTVSALFESQGFKVISPKAILQLADYQVNNSTKKSPSGQDQVDIELGRKALTALGELDVGQSVIMEGGYTLGIEAAEGTDNLIKRCGLLRKKGQGGVLVKMSKLNQDTRLDIPTIGPETISCLAKHNFNGVAIEKDAVIVVNPAETWGLADEYGLFISFI